MNNNLQTERAHLGVFSTKSYISIGDPYGKKNSQDTRLKSKQFACAFPASGIGGARPNNALFSREHQWLYGGEKCVQSCTHTHPMLTAPSLNATVATLAQLTSPVRPILPISRYVDRTRYIQTQPPDQRKKGFYSSDASRRDEFTLDIEVKRFPLTHEPHFAYDPCLAMHSPCKSDYLVLRRLKSGASGSGVKWRCAEALNILERIPKRNDVSPYFISCSRKEQSLFHKGDSRARFFAILTSFVPDS